MNLTEKEKLRHRVKMLLDKHFQGPPFLSGGEIMALQCYLEDIPLSKEFSCGTESLAPEVILQNNIEAWIKEETK